jgi:SAM-dependent methyltransferase
MEERGQPTASTAAPTLEPPSDAAEPSAPTEASLETIRLQAEEHPVIEDGPATSAAEHCLRLMHLKAYDEAARFAVDRDVLDVGCNTGYGTLRFGEVARRVVGVDVSDRAIEVARASATDGRPEFQVIDGLTLPFDDGSFDLIVSFQVIEHIEDPRPYLREIARVARPGAWIVFTTPNAATRLYPGMTPWNRFHVREYRAPELDAALRQVFPEVRVRGMFGTPTLYETEIGRVDGARQRIRRKEEAGKRAMTTTATKPAPRRRPLPVRVVRAIVPARVRSWLRSNVGGAGDPAPGQAQAAVPSEPVADTMTLEQFLEFTVDDLFYADTDLDRAMDFMAICRVGSADRAAGDDREVSARSA